MVERINGAVERLQRSDLPDSKRVAGSTLKRKGHNSSQEGSGLKALVIIGSYLPSLTIYSHSQVKLEEGC